MYKVRFNKEDYFPHQWDFLTSGQFKNKGKISIWFSDENPAQIPVKIWLKLKYGALVLELADRIN